MAWWNPFSWFGAKEAEVIEAVALVEDGADLVAEAIKDGVAPENKYLFLVQVVAATGEVIDLLPLVGDRHPFGFSGGEPPLAIKKVLLTLDEAKRLKELSRVSGGNGTDKNQEDIKAETPPPAPEPVSAEAVFGAASLQKARPDEIKLAAIKEEGLG